MQRLQQQQHQCLCLLARHGQKSVCCGYYLEGRLQDNDVTGGLNPGLAVHLNRQLVVHANFDMASLKDREEKELITAHITYTFPPGVVFIPAQFGLRI